MKAGGGCWLLAIGHRLLAIGCQLSAISFWLPVLSLVKRIIGFDPDLSGSKGTGIGFDRRCIEPAEMLSLREYVP